MQLYITRDGVAQRVSQPRFGHVGATGRFDTATRRFLAMPRGADNRERIKICQSCFEIRHDRDPVADNLVMVMT